VTRDTFDRATTPFDEAAAMYEAAKTEFDILRTKVRSSFPGNFDYEALELAQREIYRTRARLMRLHRERDRKRPASADTYAMTTRKQFDEAMALYDEAVALYEAAKADFEALEKVLMERLAAGKEMTGPETLEEERVRASLFFARVRLSKRMKPRPPG
jgi:hypothetical protein